MGSCAVLDHPCLCECSFPVPPFFNDVLATCAASAPSRLLTCSAGVVELRTTAFLYRLESALHEHATFACPLPARHLEPDHCRRTGCSARNGPETVVIEAAGHPLFGTESVSEPLPASVDLTAWAITAGRPGPGRIMRVVGGRSHPDRLVCQRQQTGPEALCADVPVQPSQRRRG